MRAGTIVNAIMLAPVNILSWHTFSTALRSHSCLWSEGRPRLLKNCLVLLGRIIWPAVIVCTQVLNLLILGLGTILLCPTVWHLFAVIPNWDTLVRLLVRTLKVLVVNVEVFNSIWLPMAIRL